MINVTETGLSHFLQKISVTFKLQRVGTMNVLVMQDKKKCLMVILNLKIADSARFVNDNLCQRVFK